MGVFFVCSDSAAQTYFIAYEKTLSLLQLGFDYLVFDVVFPKDIKVSFTYHGNNDRYWVSSYLLNQEFSFICRREEIYLKPKHLYQEKLYRPRNWDNFENSFLCQMYILSGKKKKQLEPLRRGIHKSFPKNFKFMKRLLWPKKVEPSCDKVSCLL